MHDLLPAPSATTTPFKAAALAAGADLGSVDSWGRGALACRCPCPAADWGPRVIAAAGRGAPGGSATGEPLAALLLHVHTVHTRRYGCHLWFRDPWSFLKPAI